MHGLRRSILLRRFSPSRRVGRRGGCEAGWKTTLGLGFLIFASSCANAELGQGNTPGHDAALGDATADSVAAADKGKSDTQSQTSPDNAPAGPCDPFSSWGCSSDQKCTALRSGSALVLGCGSKGSKSEGDECAPVLEGSGQTGDDCGDALACFALSGEKSATCRRICPTSGTDNACTTGSICNLRFSSITSYAFCVPSCKPLEQSGCADGEACYLTSVGALCGSAGSTKIGDSCSGNTPNECAPGATCVTGLASGNQCQAFCSLGDGSPKCSSGTCTKTPVPEAFMSEPDVGTCR